MADFTEGQTAIIELVAERAAVKASERTLEAFRKEIELHQATCPVAKELSEISKNIAATSNQVKGGWKVVAGVSGVLGALLIVALEWVLKVSKR